MKIRLCVLGFLLALTTCGPVNADEEPEVRWDSSGFGFQIKKPDKGRRWVIASSTVGTEGETLQPGDEIWEVNDKQVTIDDDVASMLKEAGQSVKIRAKRVITVGKRKETITDEKTFQKTMLWDFVSSRFNREVDPLTKIEKWTHKLVADEIKSPQTTAFIPILLMKDESPVQTAVRFQFVAKTWLFVRQITFRHGEKQWVIADLDLSTEVRDGGILEWVTSADKWAQEAFEEVGKEPDSDSLIRLQGRDYYHDHKLSNLERVAFSDTHFLRKLALQRAADLQKK